MRKPSPSNKRYSKHSINTDNRIIHKFKFQKPITATIDRIETVAYDRRRRPLIAMRVQRRRPNPVAMSLFTFKKNPNKVIVYAEKGSATRLQIFYYNDRTGWVCLSCHGDFLQIPEELVRPVIRALRAYLKAIDVKGRVTYSGYRPALHETKS